MPTQRRYAFMGPANINSNDRSARRAWLPSRCPMLVMFIVGVSVCVASGFSLFVEYDQRNRCPPPENSIVQKNSPQWQQNHMLENADDGTVFSPADPSSLDSTDAPCEGMITYELIYVRILGSSKLVGPKLRATYYQLTVPTSIGALCLYTVA